jgi:hypothetical protein
MIRAKIEAHVLEIYDTIKNGGKIEDDLVELKADWPEAEKAARRIAAHANAARGEPVLWIVGLDEERGVCPLGPTDPADWWAQVQSCFDGPGPLIGCPLSALA